MCSESESLTAYLDDELDATARAAFETHLATCATCTSDLGLLRRTMPPLRLLARVEPSAELRRRVLTAVPAVEPTLWERLSLGWAVPLGSLAAVAAVVALVLAGHGRATQVGADDELALARNLDLVENLNLVASADLSDEDLEVVAQLDQLERGRD